MNGDPKKFSRLVPEIRVPAPRPLSRDEAIERANRIEAELGDGGFPMLHLRAHRMGTISDTDAWHAKKCLLDKRLADGAATVALIGPRGTGKTQMATVAAYGFASVQADRGRIKVARYFRAMDFFMAVKDSYAAQASERDAFEPFIRPRLLVLDEVHVRNGTDWEKNALTYLIDVRYSDCKSTIMISNETPEGFSAAVGESIVSRITETGSIIACDWASYRERRA